MGKNPVYISSMQCMDARQEYQNIDIRHQNGHHFHGKKEAFINVNCSRLSHKSEGLYYVRDLPTYLPSVTCNIRTDQSMDAVKKPTPLTHFYKIFSRINFFSCSALRTHLLRYVAASKSSISPQTRP